MMHKNNLIVYVIAIFLTVTAIIMVYICNKPYPEATATYAPTNSLGNEQSLSLFLPLSTKQCSPDKGYDFCYEFSYRYCHSKYDYLCAEPKIKLEVTQPYDIIGDKYQYLLKKAKIKVRCNVITGSKAKLYVWYGNLNSMDDIWNYVKCDKNGCRGSGLQLLGDLSHSKTNYIEKEIELPTDSEGWVRLPKFICWAYSYAESVVTGARVYAWVAGSYGWAKDYSDYWKVVECKSDGDCPSGKVCSNYKCMEDCNVMDGWYCSEVYGYYGNYEGVSVGYRDYYTTAHGCDFSTVKGKMYRNGWYCKDDTTREYRTYYCTSFDRGDKEEDVFSYKVTKTERCPAGTRCVDGECKSPSLTDWIIDIVSGGR